MSARLRSAAAAVPATKPSCTALLSHPAWTSLSAHAALSCGARALAENHTDIPSSSASARSASAEPFRFTTRLALQPLEPAPHHRRRRARAAAVHVLVRLLHVRVVPRPLRDVCDALGDRPDAVIDIGEGRR